MHRVAASAPLWLIASVAVLSLAAGLAWASDLSEIAGHPEPTPSITSTASPTDSPTPTATATETPTATPTSTPVPDRHDCDQMRGTPYRSPRERRWFLAHCVTPTATPVPVSEALSQTSAVAPAAAAPKAASGDWRSLVCSYNWDCGWALSVIYCESGGDPNAYNPAGPYVGLFQIYDPSVSLFDPAANIAAAYAIYQSQGPSAWGVCG